MRYMCDKFGGMSRVVVNTTWYCNACSPSVKVVSPVFETLCKIMKNF